MLALDTSSASRIVARYDDDEDNPGYEEFEEDSEIDEDEEEYDEEEYDEYEEDFDEDDEPRRGKKDDWE